MSNLYRAVMVLLLTFAFIVACNNMKSSDPGAASPAAKVKKVKVGSKTMTLEEEEEDDVEEKPTAQATK